MQNVIDMRTAKSCRAFKPARTCAVRHAARVNWTQNRRSHIRVRASADDLDMEDKLEMFMKKQAELESGAAFARTAAIDQVIGGDVVSDEAAKKYCRDIVAIIQALKDTRDMAFNEIKLVVSIEDPRVKERRALGIEDDSGISRDEMAAALIDVSEGRIPKDRIALKVLYEEMSEWPFLTSDPTETSPPTTLGQTKDYSAIGGSSQVAKPYMMGQEARGNEKPQSVWDMLPAWVGYGALYGVSAIPVMLAGGCILILFANALK